MYQGDAYLILEPKVYTLACVLIISQVAFAAFVSGWAAASVRLVIAVVWISGLFLAIGGGTVPGLTAAPFMYPTKAVAGVAALISAESLLLYVILRPRRLVDSPGRFVFAEILFLPLLIAFGAPSTDLPGYSYAHSGFLLLVNLALVLNVGAVVVKRRFQAMPRRAG